MDEPTQAQIPPSTPPLPTSQSTNGKWLAGISAIAVLFIAFLAFKLLSISNTSKPSDTSSQNKAAYTPPIQRIFFKPDPATKTLNLTLFDQNDQPIAEGSIQSGMAQLAQVGNRFLLAKTQQRQFGLDNLNRNYDGENELYFFGPGGLQVLDKMFVRQLIGYESGQRTFSGYFPVDESHLVFKGCISAQPMRCSTYLADTDNQTVTQLSGLDATLNIPGVRLVQAGSDGHTIYYMDRNTLLTVDIESQKITARKSLTLHKSYYGHYQLSPDGRTLVYSDHGEPYFYMHDIPTNKSYTIELPPRWFSESLGGTTTTLDPLWSPDSSALAIVMWYDTAEKPGEVGFYTVNYLDVARRKLVTVYDKPAGIVRRDPDVKSLAWQGNDSFTFTLADNFDINQLKSYTSYQYKKGETSAKPLPAERGAFLGYPDRLHSN